MRTVKDLVEHMKKHKDAVILVGPEAIKSIYKSPTIDELKENWTVKNLRRSPNKFWEFYKTNVFIDPVVQSVSKTQDNILDLYSMGIVGHIFDLNSDGLMKHDRGPILQNYTQLHGSNLSFTCQNPKCKIQYSYKSAIDEDSMPLCEICGKPLRPDVLISGENYDDDRFHALKYLITTTHTLIVIGIDYSEEPITDLIATFGDIKAMSNSSDKEDEVRMLVGIHDYDLGFDLNDIAFFEFLVSDDCDAATTRLLQAFK